MFKLESYITPLIMGYVDKYVKLRQEDFQLSLWGGDAVLNNLDLRLDELEKVLQLPVMFQSGHIHELRLHVPWTKLGSEPVVITINTVECILKVRDTAYDAGSSSPSSGTPGKTAQQRPRVKRRSPVDEELPPGYLQSIVSRIINNVTFIINNLILKFVEDDIVLSVNVKSAECYSVDKEWNRAFVDLSANDLALRKVLNFADLTVCMDKTNSSGHIESYQEPMAYRCAVTCRLHMEYDSVVAKFPKVTRFNMYCETLNLSVTDTQLPMLVHLIQMCVAMYYGLLDIPTSTTGSNSGEAALPQGTQDMGEATSTDSGLDSDLDLGWASWAWSYVPQILPTEEAGADDGDDAAAWERRKKPAAHILSIGFYAHQGTITFKMSEKARESSELPHRKMHFHPFLRLGAEGVAMEVLMQGLTFFDVQFGITSFNLATCGNCLCGVADEAVARCNTLLRGGEPLDTKIGLMYLSNSLFDDISWENRGQKSHHIVDGDEHRLVYTEQNALQRFGAFWVDSVYTYEKSEKRGAGSNSSQTDQSEPVFLKEFSTLRFVLGNTHLNFSSSFHHRVGKFWNCATNHQYQPYGSAKSTSVESSSERPKPSEEHVKSLEEFIPTHVLNLTFIKPTVTILSSEHPHCDIARKNYKSRHKKRETKANEENAHLVPLPALVVSTSRFDLQVTRPMYPGRLVKMVTAIAGPSSNLLHHCHSHTQIKLFSLQAGLQKMNSDGQNSQPLTIVPPCSFALYLRSLLLPKLWTSSSLAIKEWMYEIPAASVNVNKASVLLCTRVIASWVAPKEYANVEDSLLDDLFPTSAESTHQNFPLLEVGLYGLEFKSCGSMLVNAVTASLASLHVFLYTPGLGGKLSVIPILYGPNDTSKICDREFFSQPKLEKNDFCADCVTLTFQKPKLSSVAEAQALALLDCQGFCVWLDPCLVSWFHYCPQPRPKQRDNSVAVTLDLSLAQLTSPLNAMSQASAHSNSSPSHTGPSRKQPSSQPAGGTRDGGTRNAGQSSLPEDAEREKGGSDGEETFGQILAKRFPFLRSLHVQLVLKPSVVFLPKASIPHTEPSSDILSLVHQAHLSGRLADTLVLCLPSVTVSSAMTRPMSVVQDLPVTSIQGSLIGEKLPWTIKISNAGIYALLSRRPDPVFLVHPLNVVSTLAVTCKYNPPTSEIISSLGMCLHIDVGPAMVDLTSAQLHLCSTVVGMTSNVVKNAGDMVTECTRHLVRKSVEKSPLTTPRTVVDQRKSVSSANKIESVRSAENVAENVTTDMSEDFSHDTSPLHESIIDDAEESGVKLSLWLQLMIPKMQCALYHTCSKTHQEKGVRMTLEHLDLSLDSQSVYSKAKATLGLLSVQCSTRGSDGTWCWSGPEGIVLSCVKQLPCSMRMVSSKLWLAENTTAVPFAQPHDIMSRDKKHGVLSVTFTRALCKNVKKRLRRANVELAGLNELGCTDATDVEVEGSGTYSSDLDDFYFYEYLSEVCVKTEPFDFVLKPELMHILFSFLGGSSGKKGEKTDLKERSHSIDGQGRSSFGHTQADSSQKTDAFKGMSVHDLPLVYADLGVIRIFIPASPQPLDLQSLAEVSTTESVDATLATPVAASSNKEKRMGLEEPYPRGNVTGAANQTHSNPGGTHQITSPSSPQGIIVLEPGVSDKSPVKDRTSSQKDLSSSVHSSSHNPTAALAPSTLSHDVLVIQINSCLIQPQADNPLPREAQDKELFLRAVHAGLTHLPGAVVEDRQYQANVKGLSLSTGVWSQMMKEVKSAELHRSPTGSTYQIPALDWNTFLMDSAAHERNDICLIPLAMAFDLCLVVAPPITYIPQQERLVGGKQLKLICGMTTELNLTSDLDLYLSTCQAQLLTKIVEQFLDCFAVDYGGVGSQGPMSHSGSPLVPPHDGRGRRSLLPVDHSLQQFGVDSGVESDLSTLTLDRGQQQAMQQQHPTVTPKTDGKRVSVAASSKSKRETNDIGGQPLSFLPPLNVLLTAGRITCTVYTHKVLEESVTLEMPLFWERSGGQPHPSDQTGSVGSHGTGLSDNLGQYLSMAPTRHASESGAEEAEDEDLDEDYSDMNEEACSFNFMKQGSEDNLKKIIPKGSTCVVPFLYMYMTQPHFILANQSIENAKLELSCYDMLVKGASEKHVSTVDEYHVIPDCADFNVHWLETRAGQPHPYTGIPPSLFTARYVRESQGPDTVSLLLARPVQLKVSQLAVEQILAFTEELCHQSPHSHAQPKPRDVRKETVNSGDTGHGWDPFSLAQKFEVSTSQVVVAMEMSEEETSVGGIVSVESVTAEANANKEKTETTTSVNGQVQVKDLVVKTVYEKKIRPLIGPFTTNLDACLTWIPISTHLVLPQFWMALDSSMILAKVGQEHLFCVNELIRQASVFQEKLFTAGYLGGHHKTNNDPTSSGHGDQILPEPPAEFVVDHSYDDLRCGGFQYTEGPDGANLQPEANEIVFTIGHRGRQENSSMCWCYPHPRVITRVYLTPVPFGLTWRTSARSGSSVKPTTIPCVLQCWDEIGSVFVDCAEFHLSEDAPVTVTMPEPRPSSAMQLKLAKMWRVVLLQFNSDTGSEESVEEEGGEAVLPASLAACTCVDSVCIPSLIPTAQMSVSVPAMELHLCNHLAYNGTELPRKLSLYRVCPDPVEDQVFVVYKASNISTTAMHVSAREAKSRLKLTMENSLEVTEFGHLTMEEVVAPVNMAITADLMTCGKKQELNAFIKTDKVKVRIGKGMMHSLTMGAMAWASFNPRARGPHLIFSHYIICNNTTSTIRYGQAGTDENLVLESREMFGYSWRSFNSSPMLHLCMDKPTWKWTEPFSVNKEYTAVRNVKASDQSYVVIVQVKKLSGLQMQVIISGQVVVCNRLSQAICMKLGPRPSTSRTASAAAGSASSSARKQQYTMPPGTHLPALISSDVLVNPIQFRLAGLSTSWSHDIFLSGDRMKETQMVKIPLPAGSSYFHIWCGVFCQHFHGSAQRLVMLTPLYVVRTHLPRPLQIHLDSPNKQSQEMMVKSQGREFQLHCLGGDVTHQMSFRLGSEMQLSSPAVMLSTGLIGQLERSRVDSVDIDQMCEHRADTTRSQWPYLSDSPSGDLDLDDSANTDHTQVCHPPEMTDDLASSLNLDLDPQPSVNLNIRLSEYIPGCGTLLVEVAPPCLLNNATEFLLVMQGQQSEQWSVRPGHTIAPPLPKDQLTISLTVDDRLTSSKSLPLSEESMNYRRYNDDIGRVLFVDGYVHTCFQIPATDHCPAKVVFLTVTSDVQHSIRVICVRERFVLTNDTGWNLEMKLLALPLSTRPLKVPAESLTSSVLSAGDSNEGDFKKPCQGPQPLFTWNMVKGENSELQEEREVTGDEDEMFVHYITFSLKDRKEKSLSETGHIWQWSCPARLVSSRDGAKVTSSIPAVDEHDVCEGPAEDGSRVGTPVSRPVCITSQQVKGVTYVVVCQDPAPVCVVENLCPFSLQFGQARDTVRANEGTVQEQMELVSDLPWVPAGGWCHYTPPSINDQLVATETASIPKLHFRAIDIPGKDEETSEPSVWSSPVQILENADAFLRLPDLCDLKVKIEAVGMVNHLVIRPVGKAEVTAKEIRSRLSHHNETPTRVKTDIEQVKIEKKNSTPSPSVQTEHVVTDATPTSLAPVILPAAPHPNMSPLWSSATYTRYSEKEKWKKKREAMTHQNVTVGIVSSVLTFALQDESTLEAVSEVLCLHVHDLFLCYFPVSRGPDRIGVETSLAVSAAGVQLDNQMYGTGQFDFPVVFLPQESGNDQVSSGTRSLFSSSASFLSSCMDEGMSIVELHAVLRSRSFAHLQLVTVVDPVWGQSRVQSVDLALQPFSLYVDDTFVYRVIEEIEGFVPSKLWTQSSRCHTNTGSLHRVLPTVVKVNSYVLSQPIQIKHLTIQQIKVLLSVHASMKLFLASDHTPLNLAMFERSHIYSSSQRLLHTLVMHYASAAIFRAGIVVGSLEILGNPTGLVRSIGTGVSDLISLPYSGLTRGPGAFVGGLTRGMGSLVKNVSAGMITSVTNFASSVSRNMDRLSLDSSHLEMQEEKRRSRPIGVSDGLRQGLTGFGLSLLGALAGLADQPIQCFMGSDTALGRRPSSAASAASDLVTGVGKGLVGMLTKPIGGAAELISQTGQGILQGTGLSQAPTRLEQAAVRPRADMDNSMCKYSSKIFSSLPSPTLLLAVPAVTFDLAGTGIKVELLLTPEVLLVVNLEEDAQQQALAMTELDICRGEPGLGKVILQWKDQFYCHTSQEQNQNANKDRVAAFIDSTQTLAAETASLKIEVEKPVSENQSDTGDHPASEPPLPSLVGASSQSDRTETGPGQSYASPQYEFQMAPHLEELFVTMFTVAKHKLQGRGFSV